MSTHSPQAGKEVQGAGGPSWCSWPPGSDWTHWRDWLARTLWTLGAAGNAWVNWRPGDIRSAWANRGAGGGGAYRTDRSDGHDGTDNSAERHKLDPTPK